jgi:hypothetical protein
LEFWCLFLLWQLCERKSLDICILQLYQVPLQKYSLSAT